MEKISRVIPTTHYFVVIDGQEFPESFLYTFFDVVDSAGIEHTWKKEKANWTDRYIYFEQDEEAFKQLLLEKKVIRPNTYYQSHLQLKRYILAEGYPAFAKQWEELHQV